MQYANSSCCAVQSYIVRGRFWGYHAVVSALQDVVDPSNIAGINERLRAWAAPEETILPVTISRIVIADNALPDLVAAAEKAARGNALILCDETPMRRGGEDLKALIRDELSRRLEITVKQLASGDTKIESARVLAKDVAACDALLSVGSGGITDVAKYARHLAQRESGKVVPLVCFPTAASVTAYSSALAVLTVNGVKRTMPAQAPDAVICDLRTLADAPRAMSRSGFGDTLARSVSYGDWFLANQLGMDDSFSEVPGLLLHNAEQAMIGSAEDIAAAELGGMRNLIEALLLAGMAMSIVNQTAPLSGWEHAISHYLDLTANSDGRAIGLHGAQVGVATLTSARAYEQSWSQFDISMVERDLDDEEYRKAIGEHFGRLDRSGRLEAELWHDLSRKLTRWRKASAQRRRFGERMREGEFDAFIRTRVRGSRHVCSALLQAGAPTRFAELEPRIPERSIRNAVLHSHLIRARFTFGDLLHACRWLTPERVTNILHPL